MGQRRVLWLAGLAALSLVLSLGDNSPVYAWVRKVVPALGFARYPVKFVVLAVWAVPLLAA